MPVDHAHQHHDAHVGVEPTVDDHRAQRRIALAPWWWHLGNDLLQHIVDAHPGLGGNGDRFTGINADHVFHLGLGVLRICLWQIHLVQHRQHLHTQLKRGVAIGHGLRFHALRRIDDEQRTFTGRQGAADFIAEVDVAGRVDQIEVVGLAIARLVLQGRGLGLDGYPPLFFDVHRVEHLLAHLTIAEPTAARDQAVSQRRLAMIDVRDD